MTFSRVLGDDHGRILLGYGCAGIAMVLNACDAK